MTNLVKIEQNSSNDMIEGLERLIDIIKNDQSLLKSLIIITKIAGSPETLSILAIPTGMRDVEIIGQLEFVKLATYNTNTIVSDDEM